MKQLRQYLSGNMRQYGMVIALTVITLLFGILTDGNIFNAMNVSNLILQNSYLILLSVGMFFCILTGNVDLSVGSVLAFCGSILGVLIVKCGLNPWLSTILVLALGVTIGVIQGVFIAYLNVPPFIVTLAGELMFRGGMSKRLVDFADTLLGHFPSGLAMVSILACMFFAAITGSAIAATAAIGGIMIPLMKERGYEYTFSAPLLACGGSIGPIIPPSIPLLVYGVLASVSVADLYVGGVIPGILMGIGLMIYSYFVGKKRGYMGRETRASFREVVKSAVNALLALFMPVIILGGIMSGKFSPTEAAAVATAYALVIGLFVYHELDLKGIWEAFVNAAKSTGQILIIVALASLFSWVITVAQIPQTVSAMLQDNIHSKVAMLMVINIILLIAGTFIDTTSAIVIFAPLFIPICKAMNVDLVHFGMIMTVNLTIGMCTPPLGVCLFVSSSIAKISLKDQMRDLLPMLAVLIGVLLLVTYIPGLTLWLPSLFK